MADDSAPFKPIEWADLVPAAWNPTKRFRNIDFGALSDDDPRARQLLAEMRATWANAPTVSELDGAAVTLSGFVVPLEASRAGQQEFLLVPYFGACIHSPPPAANQIVYVTSTRPVPDIRSMDVVQVSGHLRTLRDDSAMGASGYRLHAAVIRLRDQRR